MARAPRQTLRPVAPFAAALLVVLGLFAPGAGGTPLRIARMAIQPVRATIAAQGAAGAFAIRGGGGAATLTRVATVAGPRLWHGYHSHLGLARPARVYPGLPRDFRPLPPARLAPVLALVLTLVLIGTVLAAGRLPRRMLTVGLPGVRAPPAATA